MPHDMTSHSAIIIPLRETVGDSSLLESGPGRDGCNSFPVNLTHIERQAAAPSSLRYRRLSNDRIDNVTDPTTAHKAGRGWRLGKI